MGKRIPSSTVICRLSIQRERIGRSSAIVELMPSVIFRNAGAIRHPISNSSDRNNWRAAVMANYRRDSPALQKIASVVLVVADVDWFARVAPFFSNNPLEVLMEQELLE